MEPMTSTPLHLLNMDIAPFSNLHLDSTWTPEISKVHDAYKKKDKSKDILILNKLDFYFLFIIHLAFVNILFTDMNLMLNKYILYI
jgi:hypothetical protein